MSFDHARYGKFYGDVTWFLTEEYKPGEPISHEFWRAYEELLSMFPFIDSFPGRMLIFPQYQQELKILSDLLEEKELIVRIPSRKFLEDKVREVINTFYYAPILEEHFLPIILNNYQNKMDIFGFISLVFLGMSNTTSKLANMLYLAPFSLLVRNVLPVMVFDAIIDNPELLKFAKDFHKRAISQGKGE